MKLPGLFLFILLTPAIASAQVNFEKGPENTDCHQIPASFENAMAYITDIRSRSFRFSEEMIISRYRSPRKLEYYSCDGETGYVIAITGDSTAQLHVDVQKEKWTSLTQSADILTYYSHSFSTEFPVWKPGK